MSCELKLAAAKPTVTQSSTTRGQTPSAQQQPEHFDESLAQAMQQQMRLLMDSWAPHGIKAVDVAQRRQERQNGCSGRRRLQRKHKHNRQCDACAQADCSRRYGQLRAVTDRSQFRRAGPHLAQNVSGPLTGARAIGAFQIANGYNDYLVLHFTHATLKGKEYGIDTYALDLIRLWATLCTEVDQRYFTRVLLPAAAGFLQGLARLDKITRRRRYRTG